MSLSNQLGNIGSEITRMRLAREGKNAQRLAGAGERVLELLDLSLTSDKTAPQLREFARLREVLADIIIESGYYTVPLQMLEKYCLDFALVARK